MSRRSNGDYVALNQDNPNVLSYLRRYKNEAVFVVLNMSNDSAADRFRSLGGRLCSAKAVHFTDDSRRLRLREGWISLDLDPFAVYIARIPDEKVPGRFHG